MRDPNRRAGDGAMALCATVGRRYPKPDRTAVLDVVRTLLEEGADSNAADSDGRTALAAAVREGWLDLVDALFEVGANPHAVNGPGWIRSRPSRWRTP